MPRYDRFDAGHGRDHVHEVMHSAEKLSQFYPDVDETMLQVAAGEVLAVAVGYVLLRALKGKVDWNRFG